MFPSKLRLVGDTVTAALGRRRVLIAFTSSTFDIDTDNKLCQSFTMACGKCSGRNHKTGKCPCPYPPDVAAKRLAAAQAASGAAPALSSSLQAASQATDNQNQAGSSDPGFSQRKKKVADLNEVLGRW